MVNTLTDSTAIAVVTSTVILTSVSYFLIYWSKLKISKKFLILYDVLYTLRLLNYMTSIAVGVHQ